MHKMGSFLMWKSVGVLQLNNSAHVNFNIQESIFTEWALTKWVRLGLINRKQQYVLINSRDKVLVIKGTHVSMLFHLSHHNHAHTHTHKDSASFVRQDTPLPAGTQSARLRPWLSGPALESRSGRRRASWTEWGDWKWGMIRRAFDNPPRQDGVEQGRGA